MRKYVLFVLPSLLVSLLVINVYAQEHTSNIVKTKVGNPPINSGSIDATSCPIPGGKITCGSQNVPANGCGHCGIGYGDFPCNYDSLRYSMDVSAGPLDPIYMPLINGKSVMWAFSHQSVDGDGITAIQYYGGTNDKTGEQFWIQFHHTQPGSGGGTLYSGDKGANVCQSGCKTGSGPHVHVEFATITDGGQKSWQDAPNYFCSQ